MNHCDVIIVNFNAGYFLKDAVASVLHSSSVAHVFVIDNASTDKSLDLLAAIPDKRLTIIRNKLNIGFAAGCNTGLKHATSEYVLLLNPDCRVMEGTIERLIEVLGSSARVGMTGPLLLNPDGSEQVGGRREIPTLWRTLARMFHFSLLSRIFPYSFSNLLQDQHSLPEKPIAVEAISGACMMVCRSAIAAIGPLDEAYFLHCEDLDWCIRFGQGDWSVLFVPDAKVIHQKGVSSSRRPLATEWYKHRGMIRFYRKFMREQYSVPLMGMVIVGIWLRFVVVVGRYFLLSKKV